MNLICVNPADVERTWPFVSSMMYVAMKRGDFSSFKVVERAVLDGKMLLWLVHQDKKIAAAVITQITSTEWRKVLSIVACSGKDMDEWLPLITDIEKFAGSEGCHAVRIIGRHGWERKLPQYRPTRVVLERVL